jgi:hypothetical protein
MSIDEHSIRSPLSDVPSPRSALGLLKWLRSVVNGYSKPKAEQHMRNRLSRWIIIGV